MGETDSNLPAAAVSRTIIWWWNYSRMEKEHEVFDSLAEALTELETWKVEYPWNTYTVAVEVAYHKATKEWVDPIQANYAAFAGAVVSNDEQGERLRPAAGKPEPEQGQ